MLMRTDPLREFGWLTNPWWAAGSALTGLPVDVYRDSDHVVVRLDVPGVDPEAIDVTVDKNVLTVTAERPHSMPDGQHALVQERPWGAFTRRLRLGEGLDTEALEANYQHGVLTVRIPVAEAAKPRKIAINTGTERVLDAAA